MAEITLGQFIDNMEKNGFPQISGELWVAEWDDKKGEEIKDITKGGCALGQAYWNTFHNYDMPDEFFNELNANFLAIAPEDTNTPFTKFSDIVVDYNDSQEKPIPEIAKRMRELFKDKLDTIIWVTNDQSLATGR